MDNFLDYLEINISSENISEKNYIISSSPGSGKTEFAINYLLSDKTDGLKVLLVPYKSLAEEVFGRICDKDTDFSIKISTSDYKDDLDLNKDDVLVATYEKFLFLLVNRKIEEIDKIVIDEFQFLGDEKRGNIVEQILIFLHLRDAEPHILLLSASVSNLGQVQGWLNCIAKRKYKIVAEEENINRVEMEIIDGVDERQKLSAIVEIIKNHINGQGLIFYNTKSRAMTFTQQVKNNAADDYSEEVDDYCDCIRERVAFHTSSLMPDERKLIEDKFKNGEIRIISCTPTLAAGVNLPADYVIVADVTDYQYKSGTFYQTAKTSGSILQMLGRAGRPQYNKKGYGYVIISNKQKSEIKNYQEFKSKIENGITDTIKSSLISEKCFEKSLMGIIAFNKDGMDKKEINDIVRKSFYCYLEHGVADAKIDYGVNYLASHRFIEKKQDKHIATYKGIMAIKSTMSLESFNIILKKFNKKPFDMFNENNILADISDVYIKIDGVIDQNENHCDLMLRWINNEKIKRDGGRPDRDVLSIKDYYKDVLATIISICKNRINAEFLEELQTLYLRLEYGVLKEVLPIILERKKGIGRMKALNIYKNGGYTPKKEVTDIRDINIIEKDAGAYYNFGIVSNNKDVAMEDFTKAIRINPEYAEAYYGRGVVYGVKELYDEAIEDYTKAIELNPKLAVAYYKRGFAYGDKGLSDEAIEDYTKAIQINPKYAEAYYNRGCAYDQKGLNDKAIEDYTRAIELNPNYAVAYRNRGIAYCAKELYGEAIEDFTKAIQIDPKFATAYHDRGVAYLMKRLSELCISDWKKAVDLGEEIARQRLKEFFNIDY